MLREKTRGYYFHTGIQIIQIAVPAGKVGQEYVELLNPEPQLFLKLNIKSNNPSERVFFGPKIPQKQQSLTTKS